MASERDTPFALAQMSTLAMNSSESRMVRAGSVPVGFRPEPGRRPPGAFRIAFFMS
jgi:hypothetical protein